MHPRRSLRAVVALAVCAALTGAVPARAAQVFDLGQLVPDGLNTKGQVVGDIVAEDANTPGHAGVWQNGVLTPLPEPAGASESDAFAINEAGRIGGLDYVDGNNVHALIWNANSIAAPTQLGPFPGAAYDFGQADAVDTAGEVAGTTGDAPATLSGFVSSASGSSLTRVGQGNVPAAGGSTEALGITADGATILGYVGSSDDAASGFYLFSGASPGAGGTKLTITPEHGPFSLLGASVYGYDRQNALASDGSVIGYIDSGPSDSTTRTHYLRLPNGSLTQVDGLIAHNAVNAKHVVGGTVLGSYMGQPVPHAAIWKNGVVTDLNDTLPADSGYILEDVVAINDNGDTVGIAAHNGNAVGFLLKQGFVVDDTAPDVDKDLNDGACLTVAGKCTLRAAIQQADHDASPSRTGISFAIPGQAFPKIDVATALPAITTPVEIDGTTQPGALTAGTRKLGVVLDGASAPTGTIGLDLTATATGSIVKGLQIQKFKGDGVRLGGAGSQLADSVLTDDTTGAEVTASNVTVGTGQGLAGNVFFRCGDTPGFVAYLKSIAGQQKSVSGFESGVTAFGAGITLTKPTSGTTITGNEIGVHGPGFGAAPDQLAADGVVSTDISGATSLSAFGVLIAPTTGTVSGVTLGGAGADANVISGTAFGVNALAGAGATVNGLALRSNIIGPERDGSALDPFGGIVGLMAAGNVSGLSVGAPGAGNRFQGEVFGTMLLGDQISSPVVQANTYGVEGKISSSTKLHDVFGLLLADVKGAQIGGSGAGEGNQLVGDYFGLTLAGDKLADAAISHNTIGSASPTHFTTFAKADFDQFGGGFGVLAIGTATPGQSKPSQNVVFDANAIQGNVFAMLSLAGSGLTLRDNTVADNALGVFDAGSGGTQIGAAGHGNAFADNGIALFVDNEDPDPSELDKAQVNPTDTAPSTRSQLLSAPDSDLGYDAVNALTTVTLGASSAATSSTPGTGVKILGNRIGTDAAGNAHPNELPVILGGDEHGLQFGGTAAGEGNTVIGNRATGVVIAGSGSHEPSVQLLGNTIYDNENFTSTSITGVPGLGIDLVGGQAGFGFGINPQDATQPDQGPNDFTNAPVLTRAESASGQIAVDGTLHGRPQTSYVLELFADDRPNPFGAGEGQHLLGRPTLTTDGAGNATLAASFPAPPASARFVSATATTQPAGGGLGVTSEFAVDVPITAPAALAAPSAPATPGAPAPAPGSSPRPPGPPAGPAATGVALTSTSVTVRRSALILPAVVTCSRAGGTCSVTTTATVPGASSRSVVVAARKRGRTITIGRGRLTLAPSRTARLRLTLTRQGLKLVRARRSLAATVTVTITGKGRPTVRRSLHIKLKVAKPSKHR